MSQQEQVDRTEKPAKRHLMLHPVVIVFEALLLVALIVGITMGSAQPKDHFTGTATVEKVLGGGKKCWIDLRTEDGTFLKYFRMTKETCKNVSEGDVIEVVKGKYLPEGYVSSAEPESEYNFDVDPDFSEDSPL